MVEIALALGTVGKRIKVGITTRPDDASGLTSIYRLVDIVNTVTKWIGSAGVKAPGHGAVNIIRIGRRNGKFDAVDTGNTARQLIEAVIGFLGEGRATIIGSVIFYIDHRMDC